MDKDLIIKASPAEVELALLEGGKLVELHTQKTNSNFTVGDIFLGRIKRLMPGLRAAFVDIGHKKDAFLHYTDLSPKLNSLVKYTNGAVSGSANTHLLDNFKIEPDIPKNGKIEDVLKRRQPLLVQVQKEPISTKGPRLSCEITLPGRYLVLTPFNDVVAVSKKIANPEERKRLQVLVESIRPKQFGVIVRTAAEGKRVADLHEELSMLLGKWESIFNQMQEEKPPAKLLSELDKTSSILRDLLNDSFNRIVVNDKDLYLHIKSYLGHIAPDHVKNVSLHKGNKPIFDAYSVGKQIKSSFSKTVTMASGAYLVIEQTEAMIVVDVNSGHKVGSGASSQAEAALRVNLEAAEEIARLLRLRDLGGIVIIDFIDMKKPEHKRMVVKAVKDAMKKDRAQHTVLPLSKFGLMQITRQRVRPSVKKVTDEVCPTCQGTGKAKASILVVDNIERDLTFIVQSRPKSKLKLRVHPFVESYLRKGFPSIRMKWYQKFYKWIQLIPDSNVNLTDFRFYDENDDEIRL